MKNKTKDVIVVGFALFAMFFGAGNLIFPPYLGTIAGDTWLAAMSGFVITGVGLTLMAVVAVAISGTSVNDLADRVHPKFGAVLGTVIMIIIGPLFAIPRTAATTFEIAIKPTIPGFNNLIFIAIFFAITLYLVIRPASVVDKIGKVLTPVLLIVLLGIIVKGVITPIGDIVSVENSARFSRGFVEGYQTMDALGAVILAGIVIKSIQDKGYTDKKERVAMTIKAGIIAAVGLAVVYLGLLYVGAGTSSIYDASVERTDLIISITEGLLGGVGKYALAITVGLACLTTSVGLTAAAGDFFSDISKGKLSYNLVVISTVIISAAIASVGVSKIIGFSVPILSLVYPIVIVLVVMTLALGTVIKSRAPFAGAVFATFIVSFMEFLVNVGIGVDAIKPIIASLPLVNLGFSWIIPAIVGGALFGAVDKIINRETNIEEECV
ncbi:MAG: branched-chain amino acid transport system II carrier protein [Filifactoraceae bacterium]